MLESSLLTAPWGGRTRASSWNVGKVSPLSLVFFTLQTLVHTPGPVNTILSTTAEAVDTAGRDSRFLQWWIDTTIVCHWSCGHTPLVIINNTAKNVEQLVVVHHVLVMLLSQRCLLLVYVWFDTLPPSIIDNVHVNIVQGTGRDRVPPCHLPPCLPGPPNSHRTQGNNSGRAQGKLPYFLAILNIMVHYGDTHSCIYTYH